MIDLLLPRTDAGVGVQLVIATIVFATATWLLRHRPEWRMLSIGAWVATYGLMALRTLH